MKKMIITITLLVLVLISVLIYRNVNNGNFKNLSDDKNPNVLVKSFLDMMIPHHQEAVDSSLKIMNDLDITEPKLRIFAANVVDIQSFEISKMKNMYFDYLGQPYGESIILDAGQMENHSPEYHKMMSDTSALKGDEAAKVYIKDMIKHHKSAIEMSEDYIKKIDKVNKKNSSSKDGLIITNTHPALDDTYALAKEIIKTQTVEIETLKSFYK